MTWHESSIVYITIVIFSNKSFMLNLYNSSYSLLLFKLFLNLSLILKKFLFNLCLIFVSFNLHRQFAESVPGSSELTLSSLD